MNIALLGYGKMGKEIESIALQRGHTIVLKVDELNGRLRDFYEKVKTFVEQFEKTYEFTRFEIRQFTKLGNTQIFEVW